MNRESSFYADTVGKTSNGKGFIDAATLTLNNGTFKDLDSFSGTFDNEVVNLYRVADTKLRQIVF